MWTKQSKMAALGEAFIRVASLFKILELNAHQKRAIQAIVVDKKDVFVNLPTGFGKSLIYQALPVFDHVNKSAGHIVVVVSPLVSLMDDQVKILTDLGLSAISISSQEELDVTKIEKGEYSIVFGSPEAWLMNDRWRRMLDNHVYSNELRSPRHQGISPPTNSPPQNDLATSQLATKRSLVATNHQQGDKLE